MSITLGCILYDSLAFKLSLEFKKIRSQLILIVPFKNTSFILVEFVNLINVISYPTISSPLSSFSSLSSFCSSSSSSYSSSSPDSDPDYASASLFDSLGYIAFYSLKSNLRNFKALTFQQLFNEIYRIIKQNKKNRII